MNAAKDNNNVNSLTAALNTDGATIIRLQANPATHRLMVNDGIAGSDFGPTDALRDQNFVTVKMAVSSADDATPKILYSDSSGKLLIKST